MSRETMERLQELRGNLSALAAELTAAGADSPPTDGLEDLVEDAKGVVVPQGGKQTAAVSASCRVMRGEFVQLGREYAAAGEALRFALEGVKILDAAYLGGGLVAVVFTQGTETKFKAMQREQSGEIALGNTLVIVADEALEQARIVPMSAGQCVVVYNQDAAGMAQLINLSGRTASTAGTDIWDADDPCNLCACKVSGEMLLLGGMRQSAAHAGEAWVTAARIRDGQLLALDSYAMRIDGANDPDEYAGAWSMATVDEGVAALTYYVGGGKPNELAILDVDTATGRISVRCITSCKYAGALPNASLAGLGDGLLLSAYGVSYLSADTSVLKSTLAVELWGLTRYAAQLISHALEGTRYDAAVGCVHAAATGAGGAVSYAVENIMGVTVCDLTSDGPIPAPLITLGSFEDFFAAIPTGETGAMLIYQQEGSAYCTPLTAVQVAYPSQGHIHGIALSGGEAGESVQIARVQ